MRERTDAQLDHLLGQAETQTGYLRALAEFTGEYRARNNMVAQAPNPAAPSAGSRRMPLESYDDDDYDDAVPYDPANNLDEILQEYEETAEPKRVCPLRWRGIASKVANQVRFPEHTRDVPLTRKSAIPRLDWPIPSLLGFRDQD